MSVYGYVRKDYPYSLTTQVMSIIKFECDEIFFEERNFSKTIELERLLNKINKDDTIVVSSLRAFGKSFESLKPIIKILNDKHINLVSLDEELTYENTSFFYSLFNNLAIMDRDCRNTNIKQRIMLVRHESQNVGRPTLSDETAERIYQLYHEKKWPMRKISSECDVSLGSVYKYTQELEEKMSVRFKKVVKN